MKKREVFFDGKKFDDIEFFKYMRIFKKETHRGAAIIGYAFIDDLLNEILKSRFVKDIKLFEKIDDLPLQARIDLCYLTGTINKKERKELMIIKDIRSDFAHELTLNSFDDEEISKKCKGLIIVDLFHKVLPHIFHIETPRKRFESAVSSYCFALQIRLLECKRIKERPSLVKSLILDGENWEQKD